MKNFPERLSVEITTRCNLNCEICPKNSPNYNHLEKDMEFETFKKIESLFPHLKSLVLNGIGEPLMHRELERLISYSKKIMPPQSKIGFQTNGALLSEQRLKELLKAGLNRICISIDSLTSIKGLHEPENAKKALELLNRAKYDGTKNLEIGVEIVITRKNIEELIPLVKETKKYGIDFLILSHLIPYSANANELIAYETNNEEAVSIFNKWYSILIERGYKIDDWIELTKKKALPEFFPTKEESYQLFQAMYEEASKKGISLHLQNLLKRDENLLSETSAVLREVENICTSSGLKAQIPRINPTPLRRCDFIEDKCMFIDVNGEVSPCYFLWHNFTCYIGGLKKAIKQRSFGNINEMNPLEIYNSHAYRNFINSVLKYDFPYCYDCNFALCDLMELEDFLYDCFTNTIPCGACLWCGGLFYCMI